MKKIKRIGTRPFKYKFDITVHGVENAPLASGITFVQLTRGAKVAISKQAMVNERAAAYGDTLSILATLYRDAKTQRFQDKTARVSIKELVGKRGNRSLCSASINLAHYIDVGVMGSQSVTLRLSDSGGGDDAHLKVTIAYTWLKNYVGDADAVSEMSDMTAMTTGSLPESHDGFDDDTVEDLVRAPVASSSKPTTPAISPRAEAELEKKLREAEERCVQFKNKLRAVGLEREQLEGAVQRLQKMQEEADEQIESLTAELAAKGGAAQPAESGPTRAEHDALQDKLIATQAELSAALKSQMAAPAAASKGNTAELEAEIRALQKQAANDAEQWSVERNSLRKTITTLQQKVTATESNTGAKVKDLEYELQRVKEERDSVKRQLESHAADSAKPQDLLSALSPGMGGGGAGGGDDGDGNLSDDEVDESPNVKALKDTVKVLQQQVSSAEASAASLRKENSELRTETDTLLTQLVDAKMGYAQAQEEAEQARKALRDNSKLLAKAKNDKVRVAKQMTALEIRLVEAMVGRGGSSRAPAPGQGGV